MTKASQLEAIASTLRVLRTLTAERTVDETPEDLRVRVNLQNHALYVTELVETATRDQATRTHLASVVGTVAPAQGYVERT